MESRTPSPAGSVESWWSDDHTLCGICQRIDFDKYLGRKISKPITLGTWRNLIFRSKNGCSFCRLVMQCLACEERYTPRSSSIEVLLDNKPAWELGVELCPFDRRKSESCSNKADLRSRIQKCGHLAYRFLVFAKGSRDGQKCQIQYLAHMERTEDAKQFFGRKIAQDKVDSSLLASWLQRCEKFHGRECNRISPAGTVLPSDFRLIDVDSGYIVRISSRNLQYVALSYVWGAEDMWKSSGLQPALLTGRTLKTVRNKELTPLPQKLPQTIEDAIWLTKTLGFKYLWVDALCIVQDDPYAKKAIHLAHMPAIFSNAALTIAAAAGNNANYGLPGISVPRRNAQITEQVQGLRLASMFPSFSELENSKSLVWNQRGWTLQEKLLSKRILLFTDYQVYFKCSECIWTEEARMETMELSPVRIVGKYRWPPHNQNQRVTTTKPSGFGKLLTQNNKHFSVDDEHSRVETFQNYADVVEELASRSFSDSRDVLFAINGILTILGTKTPVTDEPKGFLFALPEAQFLESLLWLPKVGVLQTKAHAVDKIIPSWSWTSWEFRNHHGAYYDIKADGGIRELASHFYDLVHEPDFTSWYRANQSVRIFQKVLQQCLELPGRLEGLTLTQINLVETGHNRMMEIDDPMKFLSQIAHSVNSNSKISSILETMPVPSPNPKLIKATTSKLEQLKDIVPKRSAFIRGQAAIEETYRALSRPLSSRARNPAALVFRTSVIKFRIGAAIVPEKWGTRHDDETGIFELLNGNNQCVGELHATFGIARSRGGQLADFLTISWGFGIRHADVHDRLVPRWTVSLDGSKWVPDEHLGEMLNEMDIEKRRHSIASEKIPIEEKRPPVAKRSFSMNEKRSVLKRYSSPSPARSFKAAMSERHSTGEISSTLKSSKPPVTLRRYSGSTYRPGMSERHSTPEIPSTAIISHPPVSIRRYSATLSRPPSISRSSTYQGSVYSGPSLSKRRSSSKVPSVSTNTEKQRLDSVLEGTTLAGDDTVKSLDLSMDRSIDRYKLESRGRTRKEEPKMLDVTSGLKRGDRMPRTLWPAVNLIFVEMVGGRASRLGVGKVVMTAWEEDRTPGQEVIFV